MVWGCLVLYGAVALGNAARLAVPDIIDPEQAYPFLATQLLPPVIAGVVLAAIVSAMMSTADSQLLVVSSAIARDFIQKILSPGATERALQLISRVTVLGVGLIALVLAIGEVRAVFWFVLFAWSGLGASFGPPILLSLFWKGTSRIGAAAGMVTGFVVTVAWKLKLKTVVADVTGLSLYELVPAFVLSMLLTWLVSLAFPPARENDPGPRSPVDSRTGAS
jgi:Na+/proline symporter